jgi:NAD+ synthase (glutamine-hydrolysing)
VKAGEEFFNLHAHDLVRVAIGTPALRVADPAFNAAQTIALIREAADRRAALVLFPELGLSAYTCDDLFHQRALLDACLEALGRVTEASARLPLVSVVGLPLVVDDGLYNCAAVVAGGRLLGVVPKTYLPSYREFYERRQFVSGDGARRDSLEVLGQHDVPFGARLLFRLAA